MHPRSSPRRCSVTNALAGHDRLSAICGKRVGSRRTCATMASRAMRNNAARSDSGIASTPLGFLSMLRLRLRYELRGQIADDRRLVAGDVAGVAVFQDRGAGCPEVPRRAHHGHGRSTAAGVFGLLVERPLQALRVAPRNMIDDDRIEARSGDGVVIV